MTDRGLGQGDSLASGKRRVGKVLRIDLERLRPFVQDPDWPITFSDLQAAFAKDLYASRHIAAMLAEAQLIRRIAPGPRGKPTYLLQRTLLQVLTRRHPQRLSREHALQCALDAIEAMADWNGKGRAVRVVGIAFAGAVLRPGVGELDALDVVLTMRVRRGSTLVQELAGVLRSLRSVADGGLRESLVLEVE